MNQNSSPNPNQPKTTVRKLPKHRSADEVSMEEIREMRRRTEAKEDDAFRRAVARKKAAGAKFHQVRPDQDTASAAEPQDEVIPQPVHIAGSSMAPVGNTDTVHFPDLPQASADASAEALFAAPVSEELSDETPGTGASLFDDVDSDEYAASPAVPGDLPGIEIPPAVPETVADPQKHSRRRAPWIILGCILLAAAMYLLFAFIPTGPIANLRRLYIQTAMSTADHQWLATAIFPQSVIDDAWTEPNQPPEDGPSGNEFLETKAPVGETTTLPPEDTTPSAPVTETETTADVTTEPIIPEDDILGLTALSVGDTDYAGNTVTVVDAEEGLFSSEFSCKSTMIPGTKYHGYVMVVDDPSRVFVGTTPEKTTRGYRIPEMMDYYGDVVAGINASGFNDPNDAGRGCDIIGACMSEGQFWGNYTDTMASVVLTTDNRLVAGWMGDWDNYNNIRDGMQFGPVLVYKGVNQIDEETGGGWGVQPRTAIGQREDGAIIMIVIDGRVTSSIGCTLWEMADMMLRYGAVTAGGCDGGSSVILAYEGEVLNENSSANPEYGRRIPNAFLVRSKKTDETE